MPRFNVFLEEEVTTVFHTVTFTVEAADAEAAERIAVTLVDAYQHGIATATYPAEVVRSEGCEPGMAVDYREYVVDSGQAADIRVEAVDA